MADLVEKPRGGLHATLERMEKAASHSQLLANRLAGILNRIRRTNDVTGKVSSADKPMPVADVFQDKMVSTACKQEGVNQAIEEAINELENFI